MNPVFIEESGSLVEEIEINLIGIRHRRLSEMPDSGTVILVGVCGKEYANLHAVIMRQSLVRRQGQRRLPQVFRGGGRPYAGKEARSFLVQIDGQWQS